MTNLPQSPHKVDPDQAAQILLDRRKARSSLLHFTKFTFPQYIAEPVHEFIADTLDRVVSGEIKRLMVFAPPQNGKSELVSVRLPAFWLGKRPNDPIILASYAASLAESKSRQARHIVESDEYARLFGKQLTGIGSRAVDHWTLDPPHRGGMKAAGAMGGITGHGALLGLIDDPFENWEQAQSQTIRDKVWDWYRTTFRTRIWEHGAIVLIMCMTGDTPVLMDNGTERPLRDIKVGDVVATYDNGKLGTSVVRNHRNNGADSVFRIRTTGGRIVNANARHPFLVEENGELKWMRLINLTTAHKIVTVKDSGASGMGRPAPLMDAKNMLAVGDTAPHTTERKCGPMGIVPRLLMPSHDGMRALSIGTEFLPLSMMQCSRLKMESALFANSHQEIMCARIGVENCALITVTTQTPSEGFCATTATSLWDMPSQKQLRSLWSNTSDFTTESIASIEPAGVEEVFDVQIERTENFIANGLVSHNTRWHEDDLAGRILGEQASEWTVLRLPALAETQEERDENNRRMNLPTGQPDPLGRAPGEPLAPKRFSSAALISLKRDVGSLGWQAEYQGAPRLAEGNRFKRSYFTIIDAVPSSVKRWVRFWDKAASTSASAKYTAGVLLGITEDKQVIIADVKRGKWSTGERRAVMKQTAELDRQSRGDAIDIYIEQEPGSSGLDSVNDEIKFLSGFAVHADRPTGDKDVRLEPFAAQAEAGNVRIVRGEWNGAYIDEMCAIPNGTYRDQSDATSGAYNKSNTPRGMASADFV